MKVAAKLIISALVLFGIMATTSCKKDEQGIDNPHGYMTVKMTDAPADYLQVNVDVIGMNVHNENIGWINLPIKKGVYNLLALQNGIQVILADEARLPIGATSQIRLILGSNNTVVTTEGRFTLKVPGGEENGLKVNIHETLESEEHIQVVLDFDANASVTKRDNGEYILRPVITVQSITQL